MNGKSELAPDLAALFARIEAEDGPQPDPTLLAPAEGRAVVAKSNVRWNVDLPEMALAVDDWIVEERDPADRRVRVRVLVPRGAESGLILFVHGGGFAFCSPETHERCARLLAVESKMVVMVPDYRLAPEHPFPCALDDIICCVRGAPALADRLGLSRGPLLLAGDSAGANLSLAAILHEQEAQLPVPEGALLFYGTYAADFSTPSYRNYSEGPGLTRGKMERYWRWYAGERDVSRDPLACPLVARDEALAALPPLHIVVAAIDPLASDSLLLIDRLEAPGGRHSVSIVPGVNHGFLQLSAYLAAARDTLAAAGMAARRMVR